MCRGAATVSVYEVGRDFRSADGPRPQMCLFDGSVRVRKKSCGSGSADNRVCSPHTSGLHVLRTTMPLSVRMTCFIYYAKYQ